MTKLITALVVATSILIATPVYSEQPKFNSSQYDNLHYAYSFGNQYLKNGKQKTHDTAHKQGMGYIMAAILWQESNAGKMVTNGKKGHNAYGVFQNYLPTVSARSKQMDKHLTNAQIKRMLKNRSNSAKWAYIELTYWMDKYNGNIPKSLASYNSGGNYKKGMGYSRSVLKKARYLEESGILSEEG